MTTIILTPPCDFINANQRLHHHARAKLTRAWRDAAAKAAEHIGPLGYDRAHITFAIRFANNIRRDVGNYYPTAKAAIDGLVADAGLLPGDDDNHVEGPDMRRERPNGTPRVTITITPQETPNV